MCEEDLRHRADLLPLREQLMDMVNRPVNIQGTRDFVMYFRGELLGQPYLTLVEKRCDGTRRDASGCSATTSERGGAGREDALAVRHPPVRSRHRRLPGSDATRRWSSGSRSEPGMTTCAALPKLSLGFMSRIPIAHYEWHRPRVSRHAFLEIVPEGMAVPRLRRAPERGLRRVDREPPGVRAARAAATASSAHQHGFHALVGDFNTVTPGELLDFAALPQKVRPRSG